MAHPAHRHDGEPSEDGQPASALAAVPLAEVSRRAHQVRFGKTMLAAVTGALFGAGWLAAKLLATVWLVLAWAVTAARLGWQAAQVRAATPRLSVQEQANLIAEVQALRAARQSGG